MGDDDQTTVDQTSKLAGKCGNIARSREVNAAVEKHAWGLWKPPLKSELVATSSLFTVIRDFYQGHSSLWIK